MWNMRVPSHVLATATITYPCFSFLSILPLFYIMALSPLFFNFQKLYLRDRGTQREKRKRDRERESNEKEREIPFLCSLLKCRQCSPVMANAGSQEHNSCFLCESQEHNHICLPGSTLSEDWRQEWIWAMNPGTLTWVLSIPVGISTAVPNTQSILSYSAEHRMPSNCTRLK